VGEQRLSNGTASLGLSEGQQVVSVLVKRGLIIEALGGQEGGGGRYRYLIFKQEGLETNLICIDLYKKRALIL
jgi:hypothetical protein